MKLVLTGGTVGATKSTEFGHLNRKIEQSVSGIFKGERGVTGEVISFAKRRETLLASESKAKKMSA